MKITFSYSHGGKKYNSLEEAFKAATEKGIREMVEKKLSNFKNQLDGSTITITSEIGGNYSISIKNVPSDISDQVQQALSE
jgi:hypothetical protein